MLFGETVAVYFENHTEHTDTVLEKYRECLCLLNGDKFIYRRVLKDCSFPMSVFSHVPAEGRHALRYLEISDSASLATEHEMLPELQKIAATPPWR
jgi:hypothetical protein